MPYSGKTKIQVCDRLGKEWRRLADFLEIPNSMRDGFVHGREAEGVWEWLDSREELEKSLPDALTFIGRGDLLRLLEPESTTNTTTQTQWRDSPYPGLLSFTPAQAPIFFGRSKETKELASRFKDPARCFIAVIGASGSGKSSLVAAGLIPRIQPWPWIRLTPGELKDDPFLALASALKSSVQAQALNTMLIYEELRNTGNIGLWVKKILANQPADAELLIFIDQFEEMFTVVQGEHRKPFSILLGKMAETERLRTVLTLRADFYHHCLDYPPLDALLNAGHYSLKAPDLFAVMEMITGPAPVAGLTFEDGLPGQILRATGSEPGSLALMAFALSELYKTCQPSKLLTHAAYGSFGGVREAIAKCADTAYSGLDSDAQNAFGEVFKELVEVDPERRIPTRKRSSLSHFNHSPAALKFIDEFAKARLMVCDKSEKNDVVVEVAHEALLTKWPILDKWITERFDDFRLRRQLQHVALEWDTKPDEKKEAYLWSHERVMEARGMVGRIDYQPTLLEQRFLGPIFPERMLEEINDPAISHERRALIGVRLALIGDPRRGVGLREDGLPDIVWCKVTGGEITLAEGAGIFTVEPFYIAKYLVTWAQYRTFLEDPDGYRNPNWWRGFFQHDEPPPQFQKYANHPVENVSWFDAIAFCGWLRNRLGYEIRLPTEWEWQQAATGGDRSKEYPWGPKSAFANTYETGLDRSTAVGLYPQGAAQCGALDMSGNLWEWCLNEYQRPERTDRGGDAARVLRGGGWAGALRKATFRDRHSPGSRGYGQGFRVVCSPPIS